MTKDEEIEKLEADNVALLLEVERLRRLIYSRQQSDMDVKEMSKDYSGLIGPEGDDD